MGVLIQTAERRWGKSLAAFRSQEMLELGARVGFVPPPLDRIADVPPAPARVDHNRWIVDCPDCGGAEFVWLNTPLLLCLSCWNGAIGNLWRRVTIPDNRVLIEAVLQERPLPPTRNWSPTEKIEDLQIENLTHAVPLPAGS